MIKKIPIKGISRDPSGEISSDGFCAESLNVQLDMGEVAPAIKPRRVTDAAGNEISVDGDILYIHKGIGYENLIYRQGGSLLYVATIGDESAGLVYDGLADAEITDITSIGNTVIVSTAEDMYYILWRDGAYRFLGNQIPIPKIYFREGDLDSLRATPTLNINENSQADDADQYELYTSSVIIPPTFNHKSQGDITEYGALSTKYVFDKALYEGYFNEYLDSVWNMVDGQILEQNNDGKAVFPIFIRYAVRLYDGTLYAQSIPVLLGADVSKFVEIKANAYQVYAEREDTGEEIAMGCVFESFANFVNGYSVFLNAIGQQGIYDGWDDIVTGVDVFISRQLYPTQRNAAKIVVEYTGQVTYKFGTLPFHVFSADVKLDPYYSELHQEEFVRMFQDTYLAKSFTLDEFRRLSGEGKLEINFSSDYIMAQEALKETSQSMHHTIGERLFNYNKRLLLAGAEQSLYHGYPFLHSVKWDDMARSPIRILYNIRTENGDSYVICRDESGNMQIAPKSAAVLENHPTLLYHEVPVAWLAYPDSRCYRADVYFILPNGQASSVSYQMKAMDQIDVAYAFVGFGEPLDAVRMAALPTEEKGEVEMPNSLVVSKVNNPFVFPATDVVTFSAGEILNLAVANVPLSEGQAGQFPLYVFTDEGVFAMTVDAEGRLRTSHNVSRDILLSRDALIGIEQGVFFAAARGLLLLQGSRVTKVSSQMEGRPETMGAPLTAKAEEILGYFVDSPQSLRPFLADCFLAYDYANTRIIVCNPHHNAMYVYKFDTQSWHRLQSGFGSPVRVLNSFPEAQIVVNDGNGQALLDFSVLAESDDAAPMKGLIYSRDLDLDGADIYKTISRLEVRGRFKHGHVKWQLQGSNDGLNYTIVHSLRGPSWKWFRIVLVTMLEKDERISYVELDYTPKFTDRIR